MGKSELVWNLSLQNACKNALNINSHFPWVEKVKFLIHWLVLDFHDHGRLNNFRRKIAFCVPTASRCCDSIVCLGRSCVCNRNWQTDSWSYKSFDCPTTKSPVEKKKVREDQNTNTFSCFGLILINDMFTKLIQKTVDLDEGGKIDRISRYRRILLGFNFSRIQRSFFLVFRNCRDL